MPEHELEKLLGGFAADQLTPEERRQLFTAALQDQQLFNALADEQALKELLADPAVRNRLLHSLRRPTASDVRAPRTLLQWLRRPAGLAWAYGLTAAVFAVVLGTKIYQESLRQAARSISTEETRPAAPVPPAAQPLPERKTDGNAGRAPVQAKQEGRSDKTMTQEPSVPPNRQGPPAPEAARDALIPSSQQDTPVHPATPGPARDDSPGQTADLTPPSNESASPAAPLEPPRLAAPAPAVTPGQARPAVSARALFYRSASETALEPAHSEPGAASERTGSERRLAETPFKEGGRTERSLGLLGKKERAAEGARTLGVRYSLIITGPGGIDMEVDPATPIGKENLPRLAIQTTEQGYLYVLDERDASGKPAVLFPASGDARIAGRTTVPVSLAALFRDEPVAGPIRLRLLFSRTAADVAGGLSSMKQAPVLIEQIDPGQPEGTAEQAVYVMNGDPSLPRLLIDLPLTLH